MKQLSVITFFLGFLGIANNLAMFSVEPAAAATAKASSTFTLTSPTTDSLNFITGLRTYTGFKLDTGSFNRPDNDKPLKPGEEISLMSPITFGEVSARSGRNGVGTVACSPNCQLSVFLTNSTDQQQQVSIAYDFSYTISTAIKKSSNESAEASFDFELTNPKFPRILDSIVEGSDFQTKVENGETFSKTYKGRPLNLTLNPNEQQQLNFSITLDATASARSIPEPTSVLSLLVFSGLSISSSWKHKQNKQKFNFNKPPKQKN